MSYILEALKKSQQERELGRVPTLDASSMFSEDKEPVRATYWGLLAVGLAAVAVVIALYAAFRTPTPPPVPVQVSEEPLVAPAATPAPLPAVPSPEGPAPDQATVAVVDPPTAPTPVQVPPVPTPSVPSAPPARSTAAPPFPLDDMDIIGDEEMALESELDPWLEQELQRQVEAEQATYLEPPAPRQKPLRAEVPTDLINDIESFKQQVRREQGIPPPESKRQPADIVGDPTKLRLTPAQQAQVPAYFMTVHVYDQDAAKRFVLINALRYVEGEETRDGIRVERIIPEGAVLSYLGNPFFVRR
jgi:general secretion pathway protein B